MVKSEFEEWANDFAIRFPDIGKWMCEHPGTLKVWFDDVFKEFHLAHCIQANKELMTVGIDVREAQKIPAKIAALAQDIRFKESESAKAKQRKESDIRSQRNAYKSSTGSWRECVSELTEWRHAFASERGRTPDQRERYDFIDAWFCARE